jgi:ribosomal-protein-alanine N-acetyltransferase
MLPEVITTARLVLRPWAFEDAGDVFAYAHDEQWSRYLPIPQPYLETDARKFIATQVLLDRREYSSWAIEQEKRAVGGINLRLMADGQIAEIGYSIARTLWGRGLATEAARAVIQTAFETCPKLVRVRAMADVRNLASSRVLEKVGMKREGILRSNRLLRSVPVDEVWYGILRAEWETRA